MKTTRLFAKHLRADLLPCCSIKITGYIRSSGSHMGASAAPVDLRPLRTRARIQSQVQSVRRAPPIRSLRVGAVGCEVTAAHDVTGRNGAAQPSVRIALVAVRAAKDEQWPGHPRHSGYIHRIGSSDRRQIGTAKLWPTTAIRKDKLAAHTRGIGCPLRAAPRHRPNSRREASRR